MTVLVLQQLRLEAAQYHFENRQVHLQMQVRFRQALMQSLQGHSILVVMNPFNSDIEDTDLYQGSHTLHQWSLHQEVWGTVGNVGTHHGSRVCIIACNYDHLGLVLIMK